MIKLCVFPPQNYEWLAEGVARGILQHFGKKIQIFMIKEKRVHD